MYGWGTDYTPITPTPGGQSYDSARRAYATPSPVSSSPSPSRMSSSRVPTKAPVGQTIKTQSKSPVLVRIDVTGSNKTNAEIFFEKLPLLYKEGLRYLPGLEISFGAVGDAYSDQYPLQIRDFKAGADLDAELNALYPEGGGGGQCTETYELAAYYDLNHCEIPNAVNPFYFLLCDEGFNPQVIADHVKRLIGTDISEDVSSEDIFKQLAWKFKVYILRCSCALTYSQATERKVHKQWVDLFGASKVVLLEDPRRVVDTILGIMAIETGKDDDFSERLSSRQTGAQVRSVQKSLHSVQQGSPTPSSGKSVLKSNDSKALKSKKLVD